MNAVVREAVVGGLVGEALSALLRSACHAESNQYGACLSLAWLPAVGAMAKEGDELAMLCFLSCQMPMFAKDFAVSRTCWKWASME